MEPRTTRRALVAGIGAMALAPAIAQPEYRLLHARAEGFDGTVPGPLLRIRRGEELSVRLVNELNRPAAVHWHGVRAPNPMDGVPGLTQAGVAPGASFDYRFAPPDAGTFWYRAPFGPAELFGPLIVDEAEPVAVDHDMVLLLTGAPVRDIPVTANERLRLRLINAGADFATLRIERHPVHVMAIDGQPAEPFLAREGRITLSPGNRADLFVDAILAPGTTAPVTLGDAPITRLVYSDRAGGALRPDPKPLPPNPLPARMDFRGALRAELDLGAATDSLPGSPLFSVRRGRTVMLALKTATPAMSLHIHGHHVRLLDALDDGWKPFWLDTILVMPQMVARVALVADNLGKWLLEAREIGASRQALAWFEVT